MPRLLIAAIPRQFQTRRIHSQFGLLAGRLGLGIPMLRNIRSRLRCRRVPNGDWWKKANIQLYGWVDLGMNVSTSHDGPYPNAPAAYAQLANTFDLNQATFYIERVPDTIQTDHFDWGFRFTSLYGTDLPVYYGGRLLQSAIAKTTLRRTDLLGISMATTP